jgi:hypothetical protein
MRSIAPQHLHTSAYVKHTSSIRQHTPAHAVYSPTAPVHVLVGLFGLVEAFEVNGDFGFLLSLVAEVLQAGSVKALFIY